MSKNIEVIENFYKEVFNEKFYLQGEFFPLRKGFEEYHYNSGKFDVDKILRTYTEKFGYGFNYSAGLGISNPILKIIEGENRREKNRYTFSYQREFQILNSISGKKTKEVFGGEERYSNAVETLLILGMNMYKYKSFRSGLPENFDIITSSKWYYDFEQRRDTVSPLEFNETFPSYVVVSVDETMKRITLRDHPLSSRLDFVRNLPKQILLRES